ncbi:hypothetical protein IKE67_01420 [bacterium]|nr:hypothetical protein [bacterium]
MNINNISTNLNNNNIPNSSKKLVATSKVQDDNFEMKEISFNPDDADKFLQTIKDQHDSPKFSSEKIRKEIIENVKAEPKKWTYISKLAGLNNTFYSDVLNLSAKPLDDLKVATSVISLKDTKGDFRFSNYNVSKILTFEKSEMKKILPLARTQLSAENVIVAAKQKNIDSEKLVEDINSLSNMVGKNDLKEIKFAKDDYNGNDYTLTALKNDNSYVKEVFDSNMKRYSLETSSSYKSENGKEFEIRKVTDDRNNTVAKTRYETMIIDDKKEKIVTHEVRLFKDKNGKVVKTTYLEPSDVKGVYDIKNIYPNGKTEQVSSGKIDKKTGITTIKKSMTSPLGTKTEYLFSDDPQGNRISDYKITDKNGNVLLNNSETFEVIDNNTFISSKNNQKYQIKDTEKEIIVTDLNNPDKNVTLVKGKDIVGMQDIVIPVLKKMPGEELFKLKNSTDRVIGIPFEMEANTQTTLNNREIESGNNLFVILHELGHSVDMQNVDFYKDETIHNALFEDKHFVEVYNKEKEAFNKAFPDAQRNHIAYFINGETHYAGADGAKRETIAEANALLTTGKTHEILGLRSQYLQENFPETIALLDKKLAEAPKIERVSYPQIPDFDD